MRWLTWRQHRTEVVVSTGLLLICALVLLQTSRMLDAAYVLNGVRGVDALLGDLTIPLILPFNLLPLLLGMFVGVPLVARELEQGTHRLAWTQGISRERWFVSKTFWLAMATLVVFGVLMAVLLRWNRVVNQSVGPWETFDINGFVMLSYALFGLALGAAVGTVIGKPVPAIALVIPLFIITRLLFVGLRGYYLPPQTATWDYSGTNPANALEQVWNVDATILYPPGQDFSSINAVCPLSVRLSPALDPAVKAFDPIYDCYHEHGLSLETKYQPAGRFWLFQFIESAIFLALAAGLWGAAFWWIKKKIV